MGEPRPRVLCVAGSPRRQGNSEQLLDACVIGIEEAGGLADRLVIAESDVGPCIACGACAKAGICIVADGMDAIYPRIDAADAIVVASPVYFATVPAVLKALYDRCQPYWARRRLVTGGRGLAPTARRPGALLLVRAGGDPFGFDAAIATTRSVFAVLGVDCRRELAVEGPDAAGDITGYPEALRSAEEIGHHIVRATHGTRTTGSAGR